tara:strand:- start:483 stop:620 length:138 start_codon:yes stop_codon:yes gene_type:complete
LILKTRVANTLVVQMVVVLMIAKLENVAIVAAVTGVVVIQKTVVD